MICITSENCFPFLHFLTKTLSKTIEFSSNTKSNTKLPSINRSHDPWRVPTHCWVNKQCFSVDGVSGLEPAVKPSNHSAAVRWRITLKETFKTVATNILKWNFLICIFSEIFSENFSESRVMFDVIRLPVRQFSLIVKPEFFGKTEIKNSEYKLLLV